MDSTANREIAREHLELANRHLAEGQKRIGRQIELIAELERDGHGTAQAKGLLKQFEETLALQVKTRDRIVRELAETQDASPWKRA
jgi:hypothetical protein